MDARLAAVSHVAVNDDDANGRFLGWALNGMLDVIPTKNGHAWGGDPDKDKRNCAAVRRTANDARPAYPAASSESYCFILMSCACQESCECGLSDVGLRAGAPDVTLWLGESHHGRSELRRFS
jgi:hypothetical protein